jgi:hypothetical protein
MTASLQRRILLKAVIISVILNCGMVLMSLPGHSPTGTSAMVRIADAIAAPPGLIAERIFAPREHSVGAFIAAAAESLAFSVIFYAVVALVILGAASWIQLGRRERHGSGRTGAFLD